MGLLGDDGRGYELARNLEILSVWRSWLGDSLYASFVHFLSSPSSWDSFMRADEPKSRAHILLQLRVRALLFDKASVSLFLQSKPTSPSSSLAVSQLNPNYLQLHGDDVYFTLEDGDQRRDSSVALNMAASKNQSKSGFSSNTRLSESEASNASQRFRNEELPETWYTQFFEKHRISRPYRLSMGDRELDKRTPEGMSTYLRIQERHKRRRVALNEDQFVGYGNSINDGTDEDALFFPETMFTSNCVPDTALPLLTREIDNEKVEFREVLETLPQVMTRSSVMIERLGISVRRGKNGSDVNKISLGPEQAKEISKKVVARILASLGFEGAVETPVEVLSQLLSCHIGKLGRTLKVLSDSYRKHCSALDLLKMFLQTSGYSNLGVLAELVKDGSRNSIQQTQHAMQSQFQIQHTSPLQLHQQRQMQAQLRQMVNPHNLTLQQQQQLEIMRRRQQQQPASRATGMDSEKDRTSSVQVKVENTELPIDGSIFNPLHPRYQQMQLRQQQIAPMATNFQAQPSNQQLRQLAALQIPQMQTQNLSNARARPVKVEGFQELMGGDAALKHDSEGSKLSSPSNK